MGPRLYDDGYLDETLYPRSYFMNDRRYSAVLRALVTPGRSFPRVRVWRANLFFGRGSRCGMACRWICLPPHAGEGRRESPGNTTPHWNQQRFPCGGDARMLRRIIL